MRLTAFKSSELLTRIYERRRSNPGAAPQPASPVVSGGTNRGSLLLEVPDSARNEGRHARDDEERQAGDKGRVPDLWHRHVQDRQGEGLIRHSNRADGGGESRPFALRDELEPQSHRGAED